MGPGSPQPSLASTAHIFSVQRVTIKVCVEIEVCKQEIVKIGLIR